MELDITSLASSDAPQYSGSVAELGPCAARLTWESNVRDAPDLLDTDEKREAARGHLREYGAWSREEIDAWTDQELNALMHQDIMSAIREAGADALEDIDWPEYEADENSGGRLYHVQGSAPEDGNKYYFYIGL